MYATNTVTWTPACMRVARPGTTVRAATNSVSASSNTRTGTRPSAHRSASNNGGAAVAEILEEALGDMDGFGDRD